MPLVDCGHRHVRRYALGRPLVVVLLAALVTLLGAGPAAVAANRPGPRSARSAWSSSST